MDILGSVYDTSYEGLRQRGLNVRVAPPSKKLTKEEMQKSESVLVLLHPGDVETDVMGAYTTLSIACHWLGWPLGGCEASVCQKAFLRH